MSSRDHSAGELGCSPTFVRYVESVSSTREVVCYSSNNTGVVRLKLTALCLSLAALGATSCVSELRMAPPPVVPVIAAAPAATTLGPPEGGRAHYSSSSEAGAAVGESAAEAVLDDVRAAGVGRGFALEDDGRLGRLAAWFAVATQRVGGSPPLEAVDFATRHLGMTEPLPALLVTIQRADGRWDPPLDSLFTHAPRNIRYNRVGVAVQRVGATRVAGVALASSHVELSVLGRRVEPGQATELKGRLDKRYSRPELALTFPDGSTRRQSLGTKRTFTTRLEFEAAGLNQVELLATGPSGLEVIANFPVFVGTALPSVVQLPPATSETAVVAASTLLELLNAERSKVKLRPLQLDTRLTAVATAHSVDMAQQNFFGHESPSRGDPVKRARAAGLVVRQLGENVGRGPSARELHHLLMGSPGHRANILKPEFTHVGVGVVLEQTAGERVLLATQLFAAVPRVLPAREFNLALLDLVNQSRSAKSAAPLEADAELDRVACAEAKVASSAASRGSPRTSQHGLERVVGEAYEPRDAANAAAFYAPGARKVGVCTTPPDPTTAAATRRVVIVVSAGTYP